MSIKKDLRKMLLEVARLANQDEIDAMLDKISQHGFNSLSPEEKSVLDNPEAQPEKEPYVDPYKDDNDEDEDPYGLGVNDQDVEYLKLKSKLMKVWGKNLIVDRVDYITKDAGRPEEVVEFYFGDTTSQVMTYYTSTQSLHIGMDWYRQIMKGVELKSLSDITQAFALYVDGVYNVGPVEKIVPEVI